MLPSGNYPLVATATKSDGAKNTTSINVNISALPNASLISLAMSLSTPGRLGFYVDYSELSASGMHTFYVARSHGTAGAVTVNYSTSGDSHADVSGTLSWADGEADIKIITVYVSSGDLSAHASAGLGEHRISMDLSTAIGGARLLNNARTRAYGVIDNDTMIASDANAVFYDSAAAGGGDGTLATPYDNYYTAVANIGSKRYLYGKGTTIVDTTFQTSVGGNGGAYGLPVPATRTSEGTRVYIRNWPAFTWTVTGGANTDRTGFYTESGESYQTYKSIDFADLNNSTANGAAIFYRYGDSTDINVEYCTGTTINGATNNGFYMPWGVNGSKCWRCAADGISKDGDITNENTAGVDVYRASNLSIQRFDARNVAMGVKQKSPGTSGEAGMSVRFCAFKASEGLTIGVGYGGATNGANGFEDSIVQSNIFDGLRGIYDNIDASLSAASIGQHWTNNVFYNCGYGTVGAIDIRHMRDVISYNNIHHTSRIAIDENNSIAGQDFRYLDHDQDYNHTWAFAYLDGVAQTIAQVQAATSFCDNTATDDPNFLDTIAFVPQAASSLTGGVDGSQRGVYLTGVEVIGAEDAPDIEKPVIALNGSATLNWSLGSTWVDPGATVTDNEDTTRQIIADNAPDINTAASYTLNYNTVDAAGNVADQVTRTVNIVAADVTPNQFSFADVTNADLNTLYENTQPITGIDAGQTVTVTNGLVSNNNGSTWSNSVQMTVGQTLVKASITTGSTNSDPLSDLVTVNGISDTFNVTTVAAQVDLAPVITLNGDNPLTVVQDSAWVDPGATVSDDVDADKQISADTTVDTSTTGTVVINYNTTDSATNSAVQVQRTINIVAAADTESPVITLNGDNPLAVLEGSVWSDPGATVSDNVDSNKQINADTVVDTSVVGSVVINYNTADLATNAAVEVQRTVQVIAVDSTAPVITLIGAESLEWVEGTAWVDPQATVTDNTDSTKQISADNVPDINTIGSYTLNYNTADAAGNLAAQVQRTVNVVAPVATVAPNITTTGGVTQSIILNRAYTDPDWTAADDLESLSVTWSGDTVDTSVLGSYTRTATASNTIGITAISLTINVVTIQELMRFTPSLLSTSNDEVTIFRGRENLVDILLKHDAKPIDLSVFDSFELYGLSDAPITTTENSESIVGNASGLIELNVGLLVTKSGSKETTLIGYSSGANSGVVLWDSSLPRSSVTVQIVDTFTAEQSPEIALTNGIRIQLQSRTNNALLADGTGFTIHIIEKGVSIENLSTDAQGYLIIQDVSLDTLGEELSIAVVTSDAAMTGLTQATVEDLTTYLI